MSPNWIISPTSADLQQVAHSFLERWDQNRPFEINSSGTTGLPQSFTFSKAQLVHSAQASNAALGLTSQTRALLCLPASSVGGLMLMARSMVGGFTLHMQAPSARPLKNLEHAIDFVSMVPTQLQESLDHDLPQLKQISKILVGGGALTAALIARCQTANLTIWQSYGMTETLSHVALKKISPIESKVFSALPGIEFSSKEGCLVIHYPALQTQALFTKDLIELHSPTHFTWLGRSDFAINSGGFKIIPELLEEKLAPYFDVPFFICGVTDIKWGQVVGLIFEASSIPELPDFTQLGLSNAERPKKVAFMSSFKRTETQKIQRIENSLQLHDADWKSI